MRTQKVVVLGLLVLVFGLTVAALGVPRTRKWSALGVVGARTNSKAEGDGLAATADSSTAPELPRNVDQF